jgi:hypothetical protein
VNTNKFPQFNFALLRSFWYIFTHTHGCYAFSDQIVKQNHNQPATNLNWAKLGTFQACEILSFLPELFNWNAEPKTWTRSTVETHFPSVFSSSKIKRQKDAISPQRSLLYACAGLSRDTFEREENNGFESCAKFHIRLWNRLILLQTISIIRKCYPSLFAHFHDALLHIILICPRL